MKDIIYIFVVLIVSLFICCSEKQPTTQEYLEMEINKCYEEINILKYMIEEELKERERENTKLC